MGSSDKPFRVHIDIKSQPVISSVCFINDHHSHARKENGGKYRLTITVRGANGFQLGVHSTSRRSQLASMHPRELLVTVDRVDICQSD